MATSSVCDWFVPQIYEWYIVHEYNYDFLENCNALGKSHFETLIWTLNLNDLIAVDVYKLG